MGILKFTDMKGGKTVYVDQSWVGGITVNEYGTTTLHTSCGTMFVKESEEVVVEMMEWGNAGEAKSGATAAVVPAAAAPATAKKNDSASSTTSPAKS